MVREERVEQEKGEGDKERGVLEGRGARIQMMSK